jgi:hypothetical protein
MLSLAIITSLKILFVFAAMKEGMILFSLRRIIDWMIDPLPVGVFLWLRKPLYDCLFCMSSVWGIIFTYQYAAFAWHYLTLLFAVGGINYIIQTFCSKKEEEESLYEPRDDAIKPGDTVELLQFYINDGGKAYFFQQFNCVPKAGDRFRVKFLCPGLPRVCVGLNGRDLFLDMDNIKKV